MEEKTYTVTGMTCAHCVPSVREEIGELAGVESLDVDLATGRLAVRGDGIDDAAIADAVAEASYEVAA